MLLASVFLVWPLASAQIRLVARDGQIILPNTSQENHCPLLFERNVRSSSPHSGVAAQSNVGPSAATPNPAADTDSLALTLSPGTPYLGEPSDFELKFNLILYELQLLDGVDLIHFADQIRSAFIERNWVNVSAAISYARTELVGRGELLDEHLVKHADFNRLDQTLTKTIQDNQHLRFPLVKRARVRFYIGSPWTTVDLNQIFFPRELRRGFGLSFIDPKLEAYVLDNNTTLVEVTLSLRQILRLTQLLGTYDSGKISVIGSIAEPFWEQNIGIGWISFPTFRISPDGLEQQIQTAARSGK